MEIERARLTKMLARIKEDEGNIDEAADILQEVAVVSTLRVSQEDRDNLRMGVYCGLLSVGRHIKVLLNEPRLQTHTCKCQFVLYSFAVPLGIVCL